MIHEALAEEIQISEQRKKRSDKTSAVIQESEPAAPAARDWRESPIESRPESQRKTAYEASGSGQQSAKRSAADTV